MKREWSKFKLYSMKDLVEWLETLKMDDKDFTPLISKIKQELIERLENNE